MKAIVKLALAALVTYAAWNAANAWLTYFKFKDGVTQASQFGAGLSEDELRAKILAVAEEHSIPITEDSFTIRRDSRKHTLIDGRYTQSINVLPWYAYPYTFEWHVDTFVITPARSDGLPPS